jgi:hypothetical protein
MRPPSERNWSTFPRSDPLGPRTSVQVILQVQEDIESFLIYLFSVEMPLPTPPAAPTLGPMPSPSLSTIPRLSWLSGEHGDPSGLRCPSCTPNKYMWLCLSCDTLMSTCRCPEFTSEKYQVCFYCLGFSCICQLIVCPSHSSSR